jgi:hypothetical protein
MARSRYGTSASGDSLVFCTQSTPFFRLPLRHPLNVMMYFLSLPQSYHLYLFPHLFGLLSPLRILVYCMCLSFSLFSPFRGTDYPLITVLSFLMDDLGALCKTEPHLTLIRLLSL